MSIHLEHCHCSLGELQQKYECAKRFGRVPYFMVEVYLTIDKLRNCNIELIKELKLAKNRLRHLKNKNASHWNFVGKSPLRIQDERAIKRIEDIVKITIKELSSHQAIGGFVNRLFQDHPFESFEKVTKSYLKEESL